MKLSETVLITTVCAAEVLCLVGVFAFPALTPGFIAEWSLTKAEAGWISGITNATYAVTVSVIVSLTDRHDARMIFAAGAALTAASLAGFALFADGFWSALLFRGLAGIGLAANYMPGLRVVVDRYAGANKTRAVALYTASFSLGTAGSFFVAGEIGAAYGWHAAFAIAAVAALVAGGLVLLLHKITPVPPADKGSILDIRSVFRNHRAMAYVLAYTAHTWELFAFRAWLVSFLAFSVTLQPGGMGWPSPTLVATAASLVAMAASLLGNELAERFGRRRMVICYLLSSGTLALVVGFTPGLGYGWVAVLMLLYSALVQIDSASLTAGAVVASEPGRQGATLGVHSLLGFIGGAAGPLGVGIVLDASGGGASVASWGAGFITMGAVCLIAPLAFLLGRTKPAQ